MIEPHTLQYFLLLTLPIVVVSTMARNAYNSTSPVKPSMYNCDYPDIMCLYKDSLKTIANLPTSTWVITSLDYSARDTLCARQMNFCSTYCIDATEVLDK